MTNEDRKYLTEQMGEQWEEYTFFENRSFTTWADFGAVKDMLYEMELWQEFYDWFAYKYRSGQLSDAQLASAICSPEALQDVCDFLRERSKA